MDKNIISIGVMTSINLKERFTACKQTWVNDFNEIYLLGGFQTDDNDTDLVKLSDAGEGWDSAFLKQQLGLKYMFEKNPNCEWYSIFSDDNVLFKDNIFNLLKTYNHNNDIILCQTYNRFLSINGFEFEVFAGGAGFIISNSLMKKFYPLILELNDEWINLYNNGNLPESCYACGDIAMSYFVKNRFNLDLINVNGMYSQPPGHYSSLVDFPISFHYIKPHEMESIYKRFN